MNTNDCIKNKNHSHETKRKISASIKAHIKNRKNSGLSNGRPKGSSIFLKLDDHKSYIINNANIVSLQHMSDYLKTYGLSVSRTTLHRYIKSKTSNQEHSKCDVDKQTGRSRGSELFNKIDKYREFIVENHNKLSLQQLSEYLLDKDISVSKSTLHRYIKSL